jgi:hypothetical protein
MTGPTKTVRQTAALRSGATLTVSNHKGSLRLTPWERAEVEVEARIEAPAYLDGEWAAGLVEATRIEVGGSPEELTIETNFRRAPKPPGEESVPSPLVHYEIRAPRALRLKIRDHESGIEIGNFSGAVEIATHKGSVRLAGFHGELEITTHKGSVELADVVIENDSRVRSFKGRISIHLARQQGLSLVVDLAKKAIFHGDLEGQVREQAGGGLKSLLAGGGPRLLIESQGGEIWMSCPSSEGVLV